MKGTVTDGFVLDASVALCWAFDDEDQLMAQQALGAAGRGGAVAPIVWWYEIRHGLLAGERRGRLTAARSAEFLDHLQQLPIKLRFDAAPGSLLPLARTYGLSAYDASYLELAQRLELRLATLDRHLAAAAQAAGIPLL
ncbi:MAG: PIN domain-containing protein [Acidobacteria bacterium]|nr:MAG: PIN domain-containing protein [Acidobacteriota bacterium]